MRYVLSNRLRNVVVSRPRSGTTWLQVLCAAYFVYANDLKGSALSANPLAICEGYGLAFTHDPQRQLPEAPSIASDYAGRRVVLLLRDPRDSLTSAYHVAQTKGTSLTRRQFVNRASRRYAQFYADWLSAEKTTLDGFLVTSYEQLHWNASQTLYQLMAFWEYPLLARAAWLAAQYATLANMRKLQQAGVFENRVRQGRVGDHVNCLDAQEVTLIRQAFAQHPELGGLWKI